MQNTSPLYKEILASGIYWVESKLAINGIEYGEDVLMSMSTSGGLFTGTPKIGNCVSRQIEVTMLVPSSEIPRMAELRPYIRLVNSTAQSEWIPKGVYYIDTREKDVNAGTTTIHGYDKMLMLEQDYITQGEITWNNVKDINVLNELLTRFNLTLDSRTVINKNYEIGFPGYGDAALTCREVLGYIGAMYGGSWIITDDGELRLITINGIPAETYYLCDNVGDFITFGGDRINVR